MAAQSHEWKNEFLSLLDDQFGDKAYLTPTDIQKLGLLGSLSNVHAALRNGDLPSLRISNRRIVVSRVALIRYFSSKLSIKEAVCA